MNIATDTLLTWGGIKKKYNKGDFIFGQDEPAKYFFQIETGKVRMYSFNEEGKEFTHGIFTEGNSFGEPPLFIDEVYPSVAQAMQESVVIRQPKEFFLEMLKHYPDFQRKMMQILAFRAYCKAFASRNIINTKPEVRVKNFLENYKKQKGAAQSKICIPLTRQEIADYVGLRVETVIRTVRNMQKEGKLEIINHKIYL